MSELIELSAQQHKGLKIAKNNVAQTAAMQQIVNLTAQEIPQAACDLPIFFTRSATTGQWSIAALMSLKNGINPMVKQDNWQGLYTPVSLQTSPIFPMRRADSDTYTLGIDPQSALLQSEEGNPLFDEDGKETPVLTHIRQLIDSDLKAGYQTYLMTKELQDLGLIKSIDLVLTFGDDSKQPLHGLHTVDEEKLLALPAEKTVEFHKKGYITVLNAMLFSLFQLNRLVRFDAQSSSEQERVVNVKITEAKSNT